MDRIQDERDRDPPASWWGDRRAWPLAASGAVLIVSGLVHGLIWCLLGGPWEGPVTWRKPILFGVSGGLTAVSLGWVWARLPCRVGDTPLAWAAAAALTVEVALIDLQRWRGVASHFNRTTPVDSAIYDIMGWLIVFVTLVIIDLTIRGFIQPLTAPADMVLAIRAGLVFLVLSCLLGIWVGMHGELRLEQGLAPETFGAAGVPKFPHGAVIHAIQWLPLLAWAARCNRSPVHTRQWLVASASGGTACLLITALMQTLAGRSRFDLMPLTAVILFAGTIAVAVPAVMVAAGWLTRSLRSP
jgi:hypothetical protein